MKILVVDDDDSVRRVVVSTLKRAGFGDHAVVQAASGAEALVALRGGDIGLVLSDLSMPGMDGLALLQAVRSEGIEVVFGLVATEPPRAVRKKLTEAGAAFVIAKPFTAEDFVRTLGPILSPTA